MLIKHFENHCFIARKRLKMTTLFRTIIKVPNHAENPKYVFGPKCRSICGLEVKLKRSPAAEGSEQEYIVDFIG